MFSVYKVWTHWSIATYLHTLLYIILWPCSMLIWNTEAELYLWSNQLNYIYSQHVSQLSYGISRILIEIWLRSLNLILRETMQYYIHWTMPRFQGVEMGFHLDFMSPSHQCCVFPNARGHCNKRGLLAGGTYQNAFNSVKFDKTEEKT